MILANNHVEERVVNSWLLPLLLKDDEVVSPDFWQRSVRTAGYGHWKKKQNFLERSPKIGMPLTPTIAQPPYP